MQLNAPQLAAVQHTQGPLLVFAGAGSGKTRVITYRIANLLATHRVPPYRILAVTFTNRAAGEMKERLIQLTGPEMTGDLWVGTFHSICSRLLRRYGAEVGLSRSFSIYDDGDQKAVMNRVLRAMGVDERVYPAKLVLGRIHREKQEGRGPEEVTKTRAFDDITLDAYVAYEAALRAANAVDFDDLILHVMHLAENANSAAGKELRERFDYLLVDEFQDTNGVQYRLVRALVARTQNLCVVGDDDQSIYSWRGANVFHIRGFKRDFPNAEVIKLEQNYRSSGHIVKTAQAVIAQAEGRAEKVLWTEHASGEPVRVVNVRDERDEARIVVARIQKLRSQGVAADQMAVFYRINAQSRVLEEAFREAKLPYQVVGGMKFFDRAEVKSALSYLRLVENPRSDTDLLRVINIPARGIGNKTVERLIEFATRRGSSLFDALLPLLETKDLNAGAKKKLLAFHELITTLRTEAAHLSPSALGQLALESSGYLAELKRLDSAEADARIENLHEFLGSLTEFENAVSARGETPALIDYLEQISLVADIDQASNVAAVMMMTVHSAKGLEFDHVFVTALEEEIFPYRGFDGQSQEELEEERRLLYVAITRARRTLTLTHASARMIFGQTRYNSPSRFLSDLPESAIVREGQAFAPPSRSYAAPAWSGFAQRQSGASPAVRIARAVPPNEFDQSAPDVEEVTKPASAARGDRGVVVDYDAFNDVPHVPRNLRIGARVVHERFGRGVVARIEAERVVARFPGFGERKVLASFLRFE
jgi:DNA helicase II / ATP-dependent DNA helicase PcrA